VVAGNSTLAEGLDPVALEAGLEEYLAGPVTVGMIYPDGTTAMEWSFLFKKLIFNPGKLPDALVLVFGNGNLLDRPPERSLLRLAAHHVAWADVPHMFREDMLGFDSRVSFLLGKASVTYGLRDRIAPRVFDLFIPDYQELAPIILQLQDQPADRQTQRRGATYKYFDRILSLVAENDLPLLATLAPQGFEWNLEPPVASRFHDAGIQVLDARGAVPLASEYFRDPYHLNAEGKRLFTNALVPVLGEALEKRPGSSVRHGP
jgi:hypothetical protein